MLQEKEKLEVIIPVYNEELCITELLKRLLAFKEKLSELDISFILINDGSKDRSLELMHKYADKHDCIKVINLSRNFGHQIAVTAGLDHADADYVAIIDGDLQDPPELIEDMYKKAKEGFDIIYGQRDQRKGDSFFKKFTAKIFYKLLNKMCNISIPADTGDFRLITRRVLKSLNQMREKHRFIRGMVPWCGFKSAPLVYQRDERYAGKTKYPVSKMVNFALDAVFSFSNVPLRIATYFGIAIVGVGVLGGLFIAYLRLFTHLSAPGISTVIITIVIIGGFQIIMLGIVGEYIGRIFEEAKNRPLYLIEGRKNIE
ncbi:MAG: glycosyltransferase family 2 protein [Nitrospirae bacterium]|nr:glycosyltransferase family 2 protein [Nitrospirota bacterium]